MNLSIEELNNDNHGLWDDFNKQMEEGTFFHSIKWMHVLESLGYSPQYYLIFKDDEVAAICPFFKTKIKSFKGITTLPHSDYNHILIKNKETLDFIKKELLKIAKINSWSFILTSFMDKHNFRSTLIYPSSGTIVIDLQKWSPDRLWNEYFNKKRNQRYHINRFDKEGFHIRELKSLEEMETFYKYYSKNIEHIKGLKFPYSHFVDLYNLCYPENMQFNLLYKDDCIAGGLMHFLDDSTIYSRYLAINRDIHNKFNVTYRLFWELIKKAQKNGLMQVCLGSTSNDKTQPNYRIKRNMGGKYRETYPALIPTSTLFKLSYKTYTSFAGIK